MKFDLKEKQILVQIENLDSQVRNLEETIIIDEKEHENNLSLLTEEEKLLEDKLKKANEDLKNVVNSYYSKKKIHDSIEKIQLYINDEFQRKYNSEVFPFRKNKNGKYEELKISRSTLLEESFTDMVKTSRWKHSSKKLIFFEYLKIFFHILGGVSVLIFIDNENLDGFVLYLSFFICFLIFSYAIFSLAKLRFYEKGTVNIFYDKFFKKNIESVHGEEILFLDSINTLEKELKKLI